MIEVIQQPQPLSFVGNIPDLIVTGSGTLVFQIFESGNAQPILFESYVFDSNGEVRIPLEWFFDDRLAVQMPDEDLFDQDQAYGDYQLRVTDLVDTINIDFRAIKGGVARENFNTENWVKENFLTWQPRIQQVKWSDPLYLSYYATEAIKVFVKGYFQGGTDETIESYSITEAGLWTFSVQFSHIADLFSTQPIYFDVFIESVAQEAEEPIFKTDPQRYVLTVDHFDFDDLFVFENSLGGIDTIRFTGEKKLVNNNKFDLGLLFERITTEYQVNPDKVFEKNTGYYKTRIHLKWSQDFFSSQQKYIIEPNGWTKVITPDPEVSFISHQLIAFDFVFIYTKQSIYLDIVRQEHLPDNLLIIGPDDEQYFLTPWLFFFPEFAYLSQAIFPVQQNGDGVWKTVKISNLISYILEIIQPSDGRDPDAVHYDVDDAKTEEEKQQARDNIDVPSRLEIPQQSQYGLLDGGKLQYVGPGLQHKVSAAIVAIQGIWSVAGGPVEPDPADPTHPRFDAQMWELRPDLSGVDIVLVKGIAAENPIIPIPDPTKQVFGSAILIPAAATVIPGVLNENIYIDNNEYTVTLIGPGTINPDSTSNPATGPKAVEVSNVGSGSVIKFLGSAPVTRTNFNTIGFDIALKAAMNAGFELYMNFIDGDSNPVSNLILINLDRNETAYQFIAEELSTFNWASTELQGFQITFVRRRGPGSYVGFFIDNVILQGGVAQPQPPSADFPEAPEDGTWNARRNASWQAFFPIQDQAIIDGLEASLVDSPGSLNRFVTVDLLTSYSFVQEASIDGQFRARKDGAWVAFTPFTPAGTPTEGDVVTFVSGVPAWAAPSGGGGTSPWTEVSTHIWVNKKTVIGQSDNPTATTLFVKSLGTTTLDGVRFETNSGAIILRYRENLRQLHLGGAIRVGNIVTYDGASSLALQVRGFGTGSGQAMSIVDSSSNLKFLIRDDGLAQFNNKVFVCRSIGGENSALIVRSLASGSASILWLEDSTGNQAFDIRNDKTFTIGGGNKSGNVGPGVLFYPRASGAGAIRPDLISGGFLYVNTSGQLVYVGSSLTETILANA
jgi:hypothetical protein